MDILRACDSEGVQSGAATKTRGDEAKLNLTSLGGLLKEPEEKVTWILDGILPAGGLSLIAGKPKAGKSTFVRCLALAVAQGRPFLNRATAKGAVLYLALEENAVKCESIFRR